MPRNERITLLRSVLQAHGLDACLLLFLPNIRWLCGFTGTDGALLVTGDQVVFLTDSRYATQAEEQVAADRIVIYRQKLDGIVETLSDTAARRCGFEAATMTWGQWQKLSEKLSDKVELVGVEDDLARLRTIKSQDEVAGLRAVAALHRQAYAAIEEMLRPGVREKEIAFELELTLRRLGAEEKSFDYIVASGARGAMPHGVASDKCLQAGELVTLDFGARMNGWCSDETVTVAVGEISSELRRIYDIVLAAHDAAIAAIKPGMSLKELDAVARDMIVEAGYGDCFGHGLGHGVGLEIHEYPAISPRAEGLVEEGMVITVEPGIYVPKLGGCRIEDTVLVTSDGAEPLTVLPKSFKRYC
ncbi:MAG: aminopeptidase P family protein [Deltaproteobacteria bacterium]|nr:MAG: aminopeptidase P family protein [Deltaproteobacteria bacterium]